MSRKDKEKKKQRKEADRLRKEKKKVQNQFAEETSSPAGRNGVGIPHD